MCGIVAVIGKTKVDEQLLNRMRDRLAHRGPDGAGSWISTGDSGTVGLGHRRLSIIDLSKAAAQPMFSADVWASTPYDVNETSGPTRRNPQPHAKI